ncbi:glycosyl transferase family 41-domain-containing protein [Bisporella sp. PMI_857]|nr:glycosyl transferase family 41-domain-containing protein [Bisporella sp. PMI_857]
MLPQLGEPQGNSSHQLGGLNFLAPPFELRQPQRLPDRIPPLPFRNVRNITSPLAPPRQAFPVDYGGRQDRPSGIGMNNRGGYYNDPSEHMLRRKTPNGTLAAGYDGTPVQWSSKPPALKHVLLPMSVENRGQQMMSTASSVDPQGRPTRSHSLGWNHYQNAQPNYSTQGPGQRMNSEPGNWTYLPMLNRSNNILEQPPLKQQESIFYPNGMQMQIPMVQQPSYQPSPGPTASNEGGLFGQYWADGRLMPYRPAPVFRNPGQQLQHYTNLAIPRGTDLQQMNGHTNSHHSLHQTMLNVDSAQMTSGLSLSSLDNISPHTYNRYTPMQQTQSPTHDPFAFHTPFSQGEDGSRTPTALSSAKSNAHFKEKILSRAHTIYVDLLSSLQQSRRENRQGRQTPGFRNGPYSRTSIYPKPPRQSGSGFAHTDWSNGLYNPLSPKEKARESLGMLTHLCEENEWIDGMLLAGCLAYGLEDYSKALDWFSKIIELDSRQVSWPAMSNLAAALLCLNRRGEAEQYWLQAVKLRPSYFEAVEHLIGLLCNDHRGPEAVSIMTFVESALRLPKSEEPVDYLSETSSNADRGSVSSMSTTSETMTLDFDHEDRSHRSSSNLGNDDVSPQPGFGSSGFALPGSENGRILALVHAKGNMLYALNDINGASKAFEEAVLISTGRGLKNIQGLIREIAGVLSVDGFTPLRTDFRSPPPQPSSSPLLLPPEKALQTAKLVFAKNGELPGLRHVHNELAKKAAISTTSNSLLSLAKIFQDAMSNTSSPQRISRMPAGVGDILALYYLSLSLQPSPSTANNVGILLASVPQPASYRYSVRDPAAQPSIPGIIPGSGIALALAYYNYGLLLDTRHAHLYTNLGSLLKDIGQLGSAIKMYEEAVNCDSMFDIALANLANAVKDQGRTSDAIEYYRRAVKASPDFAEAVCGLANALNSVCDWAGRGGVILDGGKQDRWHVDDSGMLAQASSGSGGGWMKRVVDIVGKQLEFGASWGRGTLSDQVIPHFLDQLETADAGSRWDTEKKRNIVTALNSWSGQRWEGARVLRLIERAMRRAMHRWYHDKHVTHRELPASSYLRPQVPNSLAVPTAPTVLPFHTFTCPLPAKDIRMISQRNALRISCSTLRAPWMQASVFQPPPPPAPYLNIGYVSSDFNNHPLAHLMQSVFGMHNPKRAKAFCYATTASDNSVHRHQIEREAPVFRDVSSWAPDRLVQQIVQDEIHILVNLNGYTRGAKNEVFAARPAPIQMSFMGFAGTLGAEWCDYILADETAIPPDTLRPWRRNIDLEDQLHDEQSIEEEDWVYSENIIFCRDTFFCCDHAQSEPGKNRLSWEEEQTKRWMMRKELFPSLSDDAIILGNFNQLYKIEPTTFRTWLRILDRVPKAILWLLRFPDLGESNLKRTAVAWAGESVASRIWFTDVAPKHQHISRARVCDLFLDTPECNAHTTAADVLWSSTPLLTLPRYKYKMCSRMAASILKGALPKSDAGKQAATELIARDDSQYEEFAIKLAGSFSYRMTSTGYGEGVGRLGELRKLLYESRWTCALFDTKRWVRDLEAAYEEAWRRWVANEGGDIWL